jgi:predicted ATP-grasp superfamily ATP-dependent carboligase
VSVSSVLAPDAPGARWLQRAVPPAANAGALVLGGDYRGLGIVRSLGRRGIPVWVFTDEHLIAAASRYARHALRWPGEDEHDRVAYLLDVAARHDLRDWMIFPTGDETVAFLGRHHAALSERYIITSPPWDEVRWAYDKRETAALADRQGIDQPWTRNPKSRAEAAALDCPFPAILKPAFKARTDRFTHAKAWPVEDRISLLARYEEACEYVDPDLVLVQELIPGGGATQFSYAALCDEGRPLASIVARRARQHPVEFGRSSSYVESVEAPEVEAIARRLLAATRFTGLVEVELKRDPRDGRYKLLEANPRIWGWHTLGARAGVDFSYLLWRLARGEPVPELRARAGVRWVRLVTDLPAVLDELRLGRLSLWEYLRSLGGPLELAILAGDDPLPSILEVPLLCRLAWERWGTV